MILSAGLIILFFIIHITTYWKYIFTDAKETFLENFTKTCFLLFIGLRFIVPVFDMLLTWSESHYKDLFIDKNIISDLTVSLETIKNIFNPDNGIKILSDDAITNFLASAETLDNGFYLLQILLQIIFSQ